MYAPAAVKFLPWPTMPRKLLDMDTHTQQSESPDGGAGLRPIMCDRVSDASPSVRVEPGGGCYRIRDGNPVALGLDCQCASKALTQPSGEGKFRIRDSVNTLADRVLRPPTSLWAMGRLPPTGESLAARRRRIALEKAMEQAEAHARAHRDGVNALGHSPEFQRDVGLTVLVSAYATAAAEVGVVEHPRVYVMEAGAGGIGGHYALRLLAHLESRPYALREVLDVLGAGILGAGGTLPPLPRAPRRRTGPKVASGPPSQAEVERRRALLAAALKAQSLVPLVLALFQ